MTFTTPPNVSYVPHQSLSGWGYNGSYDVEGPNSAIEMSELMRREIEKAKMREEIMMEIENERIREEIIVTRRLLEAEVRRELSIEKALAFHRRGRLGKGEGRPFGERFVTTFEGRLGEGDGRPVGERFATSLDGRLGMPLELRREFGGLGTGPQTSLAPHISEAKLHLGNGKHKEQIILPVSNFYALLLILC
ncbi:hypothetical protein LIER_04675 [Lithospermum erythrorhizon]|uniref:Uncharacterized protein n=1 Tax=Lithospermum erythrorhizon TaxID=34254 RepID=A0AAV3NYV0_LITER